jgi:hypothetical protein
MPKTHYKLNNGPACRSAADHRYPNRRFRLTDDVTRVDCGACAKRSEVIEAKATAAILKAEAFNAQEPRKVSEPWRQPYGSVPMVCKSCGNDTFREADRTCYGHYANWVCAACGNTESRLTETGMSF